MHTHTHLWIHQHIYKYFKLFQECKLEYIPHKKTSTGTDFKVYSKLFLKMKKIQKYAQRKNMFMLIVD